MKFFDNLKEAIFLSRKNRFLVECLIKNKVVEAYLPNPGRLFELLYSGVKVYLTENINSEKLKYTVIGVIKDEMPVMLHTHISNKIIKILLEDGLLKEFEDCKVVKEEYKFNNSRFDFLLEKDNKQTALEVKTCTLFYNNIAMFPDAVTNRGVKHLKDLAKVNGSIIFLIQSKDIDYFLPEFNVDLEFSKTLLEVKDKICVKAYAVGWNNDFSLNLNTVKEVKIPWEVVEKKVVDSGCYLLILKIEDDKKIEVGEKGELFFKKGYYVYVGSGKKNLTKRVVRHRKLIKKRFWHIDYLREHSTYISSLLFRTNKDLECELSKKLKIISNWYIQDFGSSDCYCDGHLFGFHQNPINNKSFIEIVLYYRMGILKEELS